MRKAPIKIILAIIFIGIPFQATANPLEAQKKEKEYSACANTLLEIGLPVDSGLANNHHYCDCALLKNRSYNYTSKNKEGLKGKIKDAIDGCNYMLGHYPNHPARAELHYYKGTALAISGNNLAASSEFIKALELKPKLMYAYSALSDIYVKQDNKKRALDIITEGLKQNPSTTFLQRIYLKLGGKEPFPTPYQAVEKDKTITNVELATTVEKPIQPLSEKIPDNINSGKPVDQSDIIIGSPSNPWCRFCPKTNP